MAKAKWIKPHNPRTTDHESLVIGQGETISEGSPFLEG